MYNVNKNIDSEGRSANFIDVGIHDNVELKGVEYKVSPEAGNEFMVFHFVDESGKTLSHTEWKPKDQDPDKLINKTNNQIKRVKHIITKFIPDDIYIFEVSDFKSFCTKTIQLLGNAYIGKNLSGPNYEQKKWHFWLGFVPQNDCPPPKSPPCGRKLVLQFGYY